jgi:ATP adenylyltransferase
MNKCTFCELSDSDVIAKNDTTFAFRDSFPVTKGHTLIVPKEHRKDFFELSEKERVDSFLLIEELKDEFLNSDSAITGFNIGMNCGESAGQTVFHCHIHLIPRRDNDCKNPKGGVRGVIPQKQQY